MARSHMSPPMSRKTAKKTSSVKSRDPHPRSLNLRRFRPAAGAARSWLLVILLFLIAGLGAAALERQNLYDWWALRNYRAPAVVAQLATQDTLTPYARKIFYVNHPQIDTGTSFNRQCPNNGGEKTIVLGCYHGGQSGLFLLSVNDPVLDGVEQVTAAHEMLHGAYERLSSSDRQKVDTMLMDYYEHDLDDARIQTTIDAYKQSEPHDVVNEMHSVFGTEVAHLPSGLEQYYRRYFTNRAAIAAFADQYQAAFTSRQTAVAQDDTQLAAMKAQIDGLEASLRSQLATIDSRQTTLSGYRNSGDVAAYNAGVPGYNQLVDAYNSGANSLQLLITQYNQLVNNRNAIALEENKLAGELSSTATPIR
jgi:hypothetical protein